MPWLLLLLFALICLQNQGTDKQGNFWPEPPGLSPADVLVVTWLNVFLFWALAGLLVYLLRQRMRSDPWQRGRQLRQFSVWRRHLSHAFLITYLITLYLGWGWLVQERWLQLGDPPGAELIMIAPFLVGIFLGWERFYGMERLAYEQTHFEFGFLGKGQYLLQQTRSNLLVVILSATLWLVLNAVQAVVPDWWDNGYAVIGVSVVLGVCLLGMPWLLRLFLGLRPLPPCSLRTRLEGLAERLRFRYADVLVWNTQNTMANAMVTGFLPWVRYIILSDRLIDELTPEEIEAVFGHEIGHIKHHHLALYALFCLTSFVTFGAVLQLSGVNGQWDQADLLVKALYNALAVLSLALYFFFVFGFVSRRCERQADLFGCSTVSSSAFISALEKVAKINGMPRERTGWFATWLHPTIAQRVEFLQRADLDPQLEPRFHRRLVALRWVLALTLPCLIGALFLILGKDEFWRVMKMF